jgi:hypothetical protein
MISTLAVANYRSLKAGLGASRCNSGLDWQAMT